MTMRDAMKGPNTQIIGARVDLKRAGRGTVKEIASLKPEIQVMVKLDTGGLVRVPWDACTVVSAVTNILQKGSIS